MTGRTRPYAIIAGGGTGGHVVPALAVAEALVAAGHPTDTVQFVGARRGMERTMVPSAGFPVTLLPGRGLVRRLAPENLGAVVGLLVAVARGVGIVLRRRPRAVVSVGGYASVACVVGAAVGRVPLVLVEPNAVPGMANRLAARLQARRAFSVRSAVAFAGTPLPGAVVTGTPVRAGTGGSSRTAESRTAARGALGLAEGGRVVAVSGGSLGAGRLNEAAFELAQRWAERPDTSVYHVVGQRNAAAAALRAPPSVPGGLVYRQVAFETHMDRLYAAADVFIGRAGALTVAEVAAAGVPSILVPLPGAPDDHQTANAGRLRDAGAAIRVPDGEFDGARLEQELEPLLADDTRLAAMSAAARTLAHPDAADAVARLVDEVAGEERRRG